MLSDPLAHISVYKRKQSCPTSCRLFLCFVCTILYPWLNYSDAVSVCYAICDKIVFQATDLQMQIKLRSECMLFELWYILCCISARLHKCLCYRHCRCHGYCEIPYTEYLPIPTTSCVIIPFSKRKHSLSSQSGIRNDVLLVFNTYIVNSSLLFLNSVIIQMVFFMSNVCRSFTRMSHYSRTII